MKFDFHTHHSRCGHAEGSITDYIEAAITKGLSIIGISDHTPYFGSETDHAQPGIAMAISEFPNYVNEILLLKKKYKDKIEVLLGIEADFFPEFIEVYRKIYKQYPFDYIIGSTHYSGGKSIFNKRRWEGLNQEQKIHQKEMYYDLINQSAQSGMFDILGHIDAMKGYFPDFSAIQTQAVEQTLRIISENDVAIEINTSGKTKTCGGWYPSVEILERALFYQVKVTFGSDAHTPKRVGDDWEEVSKLLKEIGFKQWAYFRQRKRFLVDL
ncbi:MAG TPA: histidinol-phosphatase [Bacilli bacterium]